MGGKHASRAFVQSGFCGSDVQSRAFAGSSPLAGQTDRPVFPATRIYGFFAEKQDNMIESADIKDPDLKIPVYSLYGKTRIPTEEMFDPIDVLLVDLQDVGTRVYTFIYTLSYCLEAAEALNKKVVVLDRPNPINGLTIEGNCLKPEWRSFVGRFPLPMRHGLTIGELAHLFNEHFEIGCDLEVIQMKGWRRSMFFRQTELPWVPPSPNLPSPVSTMVYAGQVIWEGTNVAPNRSRALSSGRLSLSPPQTNGRPTPAGGFRFMSQTRMNSDRMRPVCGCFKPSFCITKKRLNGSRRPMSTKQGNFRSI
jgi:hypothetical protein